MQISLMPSTIFRQVLCRYSKSDRRQNPLENFYSKNFPKIAIAYTASALKGKSIKNKGYQKYISSAIRSLEISRNT